MVESLELWLDSTALSSFVTGNLYLWPALESIHFLGLSLLIGDITAADRWPDFGRRSLMGQD